MYAKSNGQRRAARDDYSLPHREHIAYLAAMKGRRRMQRQATTKCAGRVGFRLGHAQLSNRRISTK